MNKALIVIAFSLLSINAAAQVRLPKLISNGMILQRESTLTIWGWAGEGEKITVQFLNKGYHTKADLAGNWQIQLPPQKAGGPYTMSISGSNTILLSDILLGDVWLCSGQSNMELMMARVSEKYADILAKDSNQLIRQFLVPDEYEFNEERKDFSSGQWLPFTKPNMLGFSAVGYFFARELNARYKVPIGIINAALGGSPAEAWLSESALKQFPHYYNEMQLFKQSSQIKAITDQDNATRENWYKLLNASDPGVSQKWYQEKLREADNWPTMSIPGYWSDIKGNEGNGSMWFRSQIDVGDQIAGAPATLRLGTIVDADSVWINGVFIGTTGYQYPPRIYQVPAGLLKAGDNTIAIRVINNSGKGGFLPDKPYQLEINAFTQILKGNWSYHRGATMPPMPPATFIRWKPGGLYNAMIAPLMKYKIKGIAWYQGESNTKAATEYYDLLPALILNWRATFKQGKLPFITAQLPNFMLPHDHPVESNWARLRAAQLSSLSIPKTGLSVNIDLGEWNDIHPLNKQDVGKRIALQAMKLAYNDSKSVVSGPLYQSIKSKGKKLILQFSNTGSGLITQDGGPLKYFAIKGKDGDWKWANAIIQGNTIEVWNDTILQPIAVRYAWDDNPVGANLYNKEMLPASPFEAFIRQ